MLQCVECLAFGTIDEPSPEEFGSAFFAPSYPYRWEDNSRVHERHPPEIPVNFPTYVERDNSSGYRPAQYWHSLQSRALQQNKLNNPRNPEGN
jgi:hypothetical protein